MKTQETFDDIWERTASPEEYAADKNILSFIIGLNRLMEFRGLTRKDFAERLGTSKAYVTRIFKGNGNFTINTMTRMVHALDGTLDILVTPREEGHVKWFRVLGVTDKRKVAQGNSWNTQNMETEVVSGADNYREVVAG